MRLCQIISVGVCTLLAIQAHADVSISSKQTADGFVIHLKGFVGGDEQVAQAMVSPTAQSLCRDRVPEYGEFRLRTQVRALPGKALKPGTFTQEIRCVTATVGGASAFPTVFSPGEADEAQARNEALRFLKLRDGGNFAESYAMLSPGLQAQNSPADWKKSVKALPKELGSLPETRIAKVTWYVDPAGTEPGVYAAADYGGRSRNMSILCGYVAMKRIDASTYVVVRIENGRLKVDDAKTMLQDKILEMRTALRCRD